MADDRQFSLLQMKQEEIRRGDESHELLQILPRKRSRPVNITESESEASSVEDAHDNNYPPADFPTVPKLTKQSIFRVDDETPPTLPMVGLPEGVTEDSPFRRQNYAQERGDEDEKRGIDASKPGDMYLEETLPEYVSLGETQLIEKAELRNTQEVDVQKQLADTQKQLADTQQINGQILPHMAPEKILSTEIESDDFELSPFAETQIITSTNSLPRSQEVAETQLIASDAQEKVNGSTQPLQVRVDGGGMMASEANATEERETQVLPSEPETQVILPSEAETQVIAKSEPDTQLIARLEPDTQDIARSEPDTQRIRPSEPETQAWSSQADTQLILPETNAVDERIPTGRGFLTQSSPVLPTTPKTKRMRVAHNSPELPDTLADSNPYSPASPRMQTQADPDESFNIETQFVPPLDKTQTTQDSGMCLTSRLIPLPHEFGDDQDTLQSCIEVANTQSSPQEAFRIRDQPANPEIVNSDEETQPPVNDAEDSLETHQRRASVSPRKPQLLMGLTPDLRRQPSSQQLHPVIAESPEPESSPVRLHSFADSVHSDSQGPRPSETAVWAVYNFKLYPGIFVSRDEYQSEIQFMDGTYSIKNEDIHPLRLKLGDRIRTLKTMSPFVVTGLAKDPDGDAIVTCEGYNSVTMERENRKIKSASQQSQVVALSQCRLELGDWMGQNLSPLIKTASSATHTTSIRIQTSPSKKKRSLPLVEPKKKKGKFAGMGFSFTFLDDDVKEELVAKIEDQGGWFISQDFYDFLLFDNVSNKYVLPKNCQHFHFMGMVASNYCRSAKYLQALALGIPVISSQYIADVLSNRASVDEWYTYLLPAGKSTMLQAVRSLDTYHFRSFYNSRQLMTQLGFNDTIMAEYCVFLITTPTTPTDLLYFILQSFGAEVVEFNSLNLAAKQAQETSGEYRSIVIYYDTIKRSKKLPAPVLGIDWEWVVQCTINGKAGTIKQIN